MRERCWILTGGFDAGAGTWLLCREPATLTTGSSSSVDADWAWALDREEACGDVAGFWHTHPPGAGIAPSQRDVQTMRAWRLAFGKPLLCVIADGPRRAAYLFDGDESPGAILGKVAWTGTNHVQVMPAPQAGPSARSGRQAGERAG
jgi:hypothetical protein